MRFSIIERDTSTLTAENNQSRKRAQRTSGLHALFYCFSSAYCSIPTKIKSSIRKGTLELITAGNNRGEGESCVEQFECVLWQALHTWEVHFISRQVKTRHRCVFLQSFEDLPLLICRKTLVSQRQRLYRRGIRSDEIEGLIQIKRFLCHINNRVRWKLGKNKGVNGGNLKHKIWPKFEAFMQLLYAPRSSCCVVNPITHASWDQLNWIRLQARVMH